MEVVFGSLVFLEEHLSFNSQWMFIFSRHDRSDQQVAVLLKVLLYLFNPSWSETENARKQDKLITHFIQHGVIRVSGEYL